MSRLRGNQDNRKQEELKVVTKMGTVRTTCCVLSWELLVLGIYIGRRFSVSVLLRATRTPQLFSGS